MILERQRRKPRKSKKSLPSRQVKKSRTAYPKGVPLRVSSLVYDILWRKRRKDESWDSFFRRLLNLPDRKGNLEDPLFECWILPQTGETFPTKALARGQSVRNGVLKGKAGKFEEPRKLRECL
jgi:hypothetical protein